MTESKLLDLLDIAANAADDDIGRRSSLGDSYRAAATRLREEMADARTGQYSADRFILEALTRINGGPL